MHSRLLCNTNEELLTVNPVHVSLRISSRNGAMRRI
jgi:hypothetical protein